MIAVQYKGHSSSTEAPADYHHKIPRSVKNFLEDKGLGLGAVLPNFRVAITGVGMGPSMFQICSLLGKEEVVKRLKTAIENIN